MKSELDLGLLAHEYTHVYQFEYGLEAIRVAERAASGHYLGWVTEGMAEWVKERVEGEYLKRERRCYFYSERSGRLTGSGCDNPGGFELYVAARTYDAIQCLRFQPEDLDITPWGSGNSHYGQYKVGPLAWALMEHDFGIESVVSFWHTDGTIHDRLRASVDMTMSEWETYFAENATCEHLYDYEWLQ